MLLSLHTDGHCDLYAEFKELSIIFQAVLDRREDLEEKNRRQQSVSAAVIYWPDH